MFAVRFLRHRRVPLAAAVTSHLARNPSFGKFDCLEISRVLCTVTKSGDKLFALRQYRQFARQLCNSAVRMFTIRNMVVCGVLGSMSLWPRISYCADGFHPLAGYPQTSSQASRDEENIRRIMHLIRKLLVPFLLLFTVWLNWGQSHPVFLAAKVILVFLTTKPFPSSVYIFVDQLQHQIISQRPFYYRFKPLHAKTVEIDDYTFLCVARVEIEDEKLVLIGILGGWWILPFSSCKEVFLFDKSSWNELISLVKSRFRLAARIN